MDGVVSHSGWAVAGVLGLAFVPLGVSDGGVSVGGRTVESLLAHPVSVAAMGELAGGSGCVAGGRLYVGGGAVEMDTYPTVDGDDFWAWIRNDEFYSGEWATWPLLPGWSLGRRDCEVCVGEGGGLHRGEYPPGSGVQEAWEDCPRCHGAGGFPVLLRPCPEAPWHEETLRQHVGGECPSCSSSWPGFVEVRNPVSYERCPNAERYWVTRDEIPPDAEWATVLMLWCDCHGAGGMVPVDDDNADGFVEVTG